MPKKIYGYDVYYSLKTTSSVLVAAHNKEEARRIAEQTLEDMSKEELVSRFLAALEFDPTFQITCEDLIENDFAVCQRCGKVTMLTDEGGRCEDAHGWLCHECINELKEGGEELHFQDEEEQKEGN